jgi:hypothetical protein
MLDKRPRARDGDDIPSCCWWGLRFAGAACSSLLVDPSGVMGIPPSDRGPTECQSIRYVVSKPGDVRVVATVVVPEATGRGRIRAILVGTNGHNTFLRSTAHRREP